jgi:hypothetical protein
MPVLSLSLSALLVQALRIQRLLSVAALMAVTRGSARLRLLAAVVVEVIIIKLIMDTLVTVEQMVVVARVGGLLLRAMEG